MIHKKIPLFMLIFLLPALFLQAAGSTEKPIPDDPAVITGVLDNGLTYYIRENRYPENRAVLRLAVNAGSVLEDDDQQGLAHFVEHMAFNGTDEYSKNQIVEYLQSLGLEFGPDINAHTSFDETVYKLQVRTDLKEQLVTGLDVLNQWAFHQTFDPMEIDKERGVILEEWRLGRGAQSRMMDKTFPVLFKDSKYGDRLPIGKKEVIESFKYDTIRRFYRDWYRPDLMAVVAVGDFDGREIEKTIITMFSGYANPPVSRERTEEKVPSHEETLFSIQSDREATSSVIELLNKYDQEQIRLPSDYREKTAEMLYFSMLNTRLEEIARSENPPFIQGFAYSTSYAKAVNFSSIGALTADGQLEKGLTALLTEAERARRYGFTAGELERAKRELTSQIDRYYTERNNLESVYFAEDMVTAFLGGLPIPSIEYEWELYNSVIPGISLEDIEDISGNLLSRENRVVLITAPEKDNYPMPTEESLDAILESVNKMELEPYNDKFSDRELLSSLPDGSPVIDRKDYEDLGVMEWKLANGIKIVVKPTEFKQDEILFSSYSPGGNSLVEDRDYVSALFAPSLVTINGIGDFDALELDKVLAGKQVSVSPYISDLKEGFKGAARPADLETMFKLIYLMGTSPRKDDASWNSYLGRIADSLKNRDSDPRQQYSDLVTGTMMDHHFRARPFTVDLLKEADQDKAIEIYKDRFADFSDFTFFFTGKIDTAELERLAVKYLGALPSTGRRETWEDRNMRYPGGFIRKDLTMGIDPVSMVTLVYSGAFDWNREEIYRMQSLESLLQTQLTRVVREDASGVYGIGIRFTPAKDPVQDYSFRFTFTCDPARTEELKDMVEKEVMKIADGTVNSQIVHDVKEAQLVGYQESLEKNSWWLSQLENVWYYGWDPETIINKEEMYSSLTAGDIQYGAAKYLDGKNLMEIILHPEE